MQLAHQTALCIPKKREELSSDLCRKALWPLISTTVNKVTSYCLSWKKLSLKKWKYYLLPGILSTIVGCGWSLIIEMTFLTQLHMTWRLCWASLMTTSGAVFKKWGIMDTEPRMAELAEEQTSPGAVCHSVIFFCSKGMIEGVVVFLFIWLLIQVLLNKQQEGADNI